MATDGREVLVDEKQREAERQALRNVRKVVDQMQAEVDQAKERDRAAAFVFVLMLIVALIFAIPLFIVPMLVGS